MRPALAALAASLCAVALATPVVASGETAALQPALAGIGFLAGDWTGGEGKVAETGGSSTGRSTITVEAGGGALLRRDHTDLRDKAGKAAGGFDQIMLIYAEGGAIRGEYSDGTHVIHYVSAAVAPGKSVAFSSAPGQGPVFTLTYEATGPKTLSVSFGLTPPGGAPFQAIATGSLTRP